MYTANFVYFFFLPILIDSVIFSVKVYNFFFSFILIFFFMFFLIFNYCLSILIICAEFSFYAIELKKILKTLEFSKGNRT